MCRPINKLLQTQEYHVIIIKVALLLPLSQRLDGIPYKNNQYYSNKQTKLVI